METEITDIGKVAITPRKDYKNEQTYEWLDVVTYDGASYMCIAEDGCTGIVPTNTDCWQLLADKGHFTEEDKEKFKKAVVEESKTEINEHTGNKKTELNNYTTELEKSLENELDTYKAEKETQMDSHKATLETEMANKKDSLIEEIETAQNGFDTNAEEKTNTFNSNVETKTTEFNNNSNAKTEEFNNNSTEKINNFNSNAEEKIADYNEHVETLTSRITDLEEETNDLFNALDTEKASGTELYIEDAKPCRIMNIEIDGMYKQETTTGANFLNLNNINTTNNGITIVSNTDGSLKINGKRTVTPDYFVITIKRSQFIPKGTKLKIDFGTTKSLLRDGIGVFVWLYNQNKVQVMSVTSKANREVTLTEDVYYVSFGLENIDLEKTYDISNLYVFLHSTENTIYESYTGANPSPSPDYSQEIEQIENVKLMHDSSNLFNVTDYTILDLIRNGNAEITKTKDNFSFVTSTENYCGIYIMIAKMKAYIDNSKNDTTYNISFDVLATQNTEIRYGTTGVKNTTINTNKTRISFKGILLKPFTLYSMSQQAGIKVTVSNIKVTKNEDTESTLYKNQTINIDLKGNKLCAVSDTIKDKLLIDRNGNVALQKNVSLITLKKDNIVSRTVLSNGDILYRTTRSIINSNNIFVLCNYYIGIPNISSRKNGTIYCNTSNSNSVDIIDNNASITTADEYKTFVENKQIEVYYALATPEIIDLGQLTELPKTFEGINNIWAETNLGNTEIEIEYVQDVKKLLEKQSEQQNARLDNIEALLSTTETSALLLDNMQTDLESEVK